MLAVPHARVSTVQSGLFVRIPKIVNTFLNSDIVDADMFGGNFYSFKNSVLKYVASL